MKQVKRTIVSAILVSQDNKILIGKVHEGGVYPNCWHIPGGGVETGETKLQALNREIREEVGIDLSSHKPKLVSSSDSGVAIKTDPNSKEKYKVIMNFYVYRVALDKPSDKINISLNDDMSEYKWVRIEDLADYTHTPPSTKLFKQLGWI